MFVKPHDKIAPKKPNDYLLTRKKENGLKGVWGPQIQTVVVGRAAEALPLLFSEHRGGLRKTMQLTLEKDWDCINVALPLA